MKGYDVVFLIESLGKWPHTIDQIHNIKKVKNAVNNVAVVAIGTAVFGYLKSRKSDVLRDDVKKLQGSNVSFFACGNTAGAYGLTQDMMIENVPIVTEGGLLKVFSFQSKGYYLVTIS
ncbi:MAG: DsrE family protein [Bacteroidales bacterium]|nr:DsrE family protein [Bacteroidales bacterium]